MITDTIAAVATPSGKGGLTVIRVSGPEALCITRQIFKPYRSKSYTPVPWKVVSGTIVSPKTQRTVDEVLFVYFKGPKSYTGEDLVEITCHGNPLISASIMRLLLEQTARLAEPGEFTRRAFVNGRIDLSRAEAVAEVTNAESELATAAAIKLLQGGLEQPVIRIRESILSVLTAIELDLDFPEEEASIPDETAVGTLLDAKNQIDNLIAAGHRGDLIRTGTDIVLAGRANAGKSSVFNMLSGRDRAIVSDEPGTTRDVLETVSQWNDYTVTLVDTAGIRSTESAAETEAIRRTKNWIERSNLILYVLDGTAPDLSLLQSVSANAVNSEIIVFWNKVDLDTKLSITIEQQIMSFKHVTRVIEGSAKTSQGVSELRNALSNAIQRRIPETTADSLMISIRQQAALAKSKSAIDEAREAFIQGDGPECIAPLLLLAHRSLGEILGDTVTPDILGKIFSSFCIGK